MRSRTHTSRSQTPPSPDNPTSKCGGSGGWSDAFADETENEEPDTYKRTQAGGLQQREISPPESEREGFSDCSWDLALASSSDGPMPSFPGPDDKDTECVIVGHLPPAMLTHTRTTDLFDPEEAEYIVPDR